MGRLYYRNQNFKWGSIGYNPKRVSGFYTCPKCRKKTCAQYSSLGRSRGNSVPIHKWSWCYKCKYHSRTRNIGYRFKNTGLAQKR